ncbi:MAG: hypothetical protein HY207_12710 [Nitrospirae bacterium]|nr:hypothetical protein [Nitrospirota bacterium]
MAIYKFTGAMFVNPDHFGGGAAPVSSPAPGNSGGTDGDPVDLSTGLFVLEKTDLLLPDLIPIALTRTYRPNDTFSRPFGIGTTHPYEMFLIGDGDTSTYSYADLILPNGGRIHYVRTSPGTDYTTAVFEHTATPTPYYGSTIVWNGTGWDLTLKTGTTYIFGDLAPLQAIRDRYGNRLTLTRANGQTGNLTTITSPNGRTVELTYDAGNRITQAKDNLGRVITYTYDASGRLVTVTDPNGGVTSYTYDAAHRMLTLTDARGIVFLTNAYDGNGRVIQQTQADATTYRFAYTLDAYGNVTQTDVTDPRGTVRRVTFNPNGYTQPSGYILTDTRAVGMPEQQTTTYARQAGTNLVLSVTDPLGRRTDSTYDAKGNRLSVTRLAGTPEAVTTTSTYEPTFNQIAMLTDPLNHTTTLTYDLSGNLIHTTDALGQQTTTAYNLAGQATSVTDPLGNATQMAYDFGDLVSVTDPLGHRTSRFSDQVGRLFSLTNALDHRTQYDYDALNRLTTVTDPVQGTTGFGYDPNGNLLRVTDARTNTTSYTYDPMDRLATRIDPLLKAESYQYDANGNLQTVTDRKGQATSYAYDALNRRTQATYADTSTIHYTYDGGNRLTQIVDSVSGTITRTYDGLDRLMSETTPQGAVSYTYDAAGRRTTMTVTGQPTVNYSYDNANRHTQITQGTNTVSIGYDAANRRTSLTLPNGVVTEYAYDAASRLTGLTYRTTTAVLGTLTYTYDAAGQRTTVGGTWARTGIPQALASATYNANNQMVTFGSQTLTYDLNGNLTSDGVTTHTWDARNRLAGLTSPTTTASFQYDPFGRRMTKTINGTTRSFLYDGQNPVQELAGTTPTANLLTGLGIDEYFTRTDAAGSRSFLTDALGSTMVLADAGGAVATAYAYEPFGKTTTAGAASSNAFQYTGREDDGTGMYYYRARYYSSTLQRFTSEDPIEFAGRNVNLYGYVFNAPINLIDPSGELALLMPLPPHCRPGAGRKDGLLLGFWRSFACDPSNIIPGPGIITSSERAIAIELSRSIKSIRDAIHAVKNQGLSRGGPIRNPNVVVDTVTGEVYPITPGGGRGDSIGNIFDFLD